MGIRNRAGSSASWIDPGEVCKTAMGDVEQEWDVWGRTTLIGGVSKVLQPG